MRFIQDGAGEVTPDQEAAITRGYEQTQGTVPYIEGPPDGRMWVFSDDDTPIGSLSFKIMEEGKIVEVGLRFWEFNPRIALIAAEWIDGLLDEYPVVVARCYPTNWPVKKMLQRGGFRLLRISSEQGRDIEYHVTSRDTYLGVRREPRNG